MNMEAVIINKVCWNEHCKRAIADLSKGLEKHRTSSPDMEEFLAKQKQRLKDYRHVNSKLYTEIEDLENDIKDKDDLANKLAKKNYELENKVKHLIKKIEAKNKDTLRVDLFLNKQNEVLNNVIKALDGRYLGLRDELKAAKIKIKTLERVTGDEKDVKVLRDKFHEVLTAKETQEIEIFDLKEQISIENVNAYALQEQIKSSKTTIKDLQDEVNSKDLIIENISLEKTEILKSSSSSLADELDFADMQIRKANIQSLKPRRRKPRYHKYFQRPYSGSQNLKRHPVHAHKGNALKCKKCEKTFLSEQDLENHIKFVHYEIYKCSHRVLNNRALEKPDNNIVIKELECHHCKLTFKPKSSMKRHRKISHETNLVIVKSVLTRKVLQKEKIQKIETKSYPNKSGPSI